MYMDEGIDTGDIIHQIRAKIYPNDDIHSIGNRLISHLAKIYIDIINNYEKLEKIPQPENKFSGKLYKNKDFTSSSLEQIYANFKNGMIDEYLSGKKEIKLYQNPYLLSLGEKK